MGSRQHSWVAYTAYFGTFFFLIGMACCEAPRRKYPLNYIFLFSFTFLESYLIGVIAATYEKEVVLMAVVCTAAVCIALTLFAFQTKIDFTLHGGVLFAGLIILIMLGFLRMFIGGPFLYYLYAGLGALIFSGYLVYDTQLLIGGKHHKYQLSPDEYIFGALNLYLDIINLFLIILSLLGGGRRRD